MKVYVRFAPTVANIHNSTPMEVTLADEATVADLLDYFRTHHPTLAPRLNLALPLTAGRAMPKTETLTAGQEIQFLPIMAGG